jgi:hypothetical protein
MSALVMQITHEELTAGLKERLAGQIVTYADCRGLVAETGEVLRELQVAIKEMETSPWLSRDRAAVYARCA